MLTWDLKRGGWPRYVNTNLAGMYRVVFGQSEVKGGIDHDFKYIPAKDVMMSRPATPQEEEDMKRRWGLAAGHSMGCSMIRTLLDTIVRC